MSQHALQVYIDNPPDDALYVDDNVIVIKDRYPKSMIHWLVMPRNRAISEMHPLIALRDKNTYNMVKPIVQEYRQKAIEELAQLAKTDSKEDADQAKERAMEKAKHDIRVGVHSVPSLDNLHIHIVSRDMSMPCMKKAKHYLSFSSEFFVDFDDLESMASDDKRMDIVAMERLVNKGDLVCCWCGQQFGRQFKKLQNHLMLECSKRYHRDNVEVPDTHKTDDKLDGKFDIY